MRILYICHRFPYPPNRGGKIRPFNMIRHLHDQGHKVTVVSLSRSRQETRAGAGLEKYCEQAFCIEVNEKIQKLRMVAKLLTRSPSSMGYFYSPAARRRIKGLLGETRFDAIFVHCSSVAQYVSGVTGIPKVLDFGDMDSQKWLDYARVKPFPLNVGYWLEGKKLLAEEKRLAKQFELVTCTTKAELNTLLDYEIRTTSDWFPNGVDSHYFHPGKGYDPDLLSFIGRMDYFPNQEAMLTFCQQTWPLIRRSRPTAKLVIVGASPSQEILDLGKLDGVTVTGFVDDVRLYVQNSALMVAPLKIARGTQNKILEAMAMGVPVLCSNIAAGGVDAIPGVHLLTASTPEAYAQQALELMANADLRAALSREARARVQSNHYWPTSMAKMEALIDRTVGQRTTPGGEGALINEN